MKLSQIFEQLQYGELSQVALGGDGEEEFGIEVENYPRVVAHINMGLTELHKRFPLKVSTVNIQMVEGISTYYIDIDYSISSGTQLVKYLIDSPEVPFKDDLLKVVSIANDENELFDINDKNSDTPIYSYTYNSITVPVVDPNQTLLVTYRADHEKIDHQDLNPETQDVDLPPSYLEALLYYVASRVYSGRPLLDGKDESLKYFQLFESACDKITELNLMDSSICTNNKLDINGWV